MMNKQVMLSLILVVMAGTIGNYFRFIGREPGRTADFNALPLQVGGYVGEETFFDKSIYDVLQATSTTMRKYLSPDGVSCDLFIAYFKSQRFGSGIHSPKHCLPGGGWKIRTNQPFVLNLDDTTTKEINRLRIALGEQEMLMLYWFETRAGAVRSEYGLKFNLIKNALAMRPTDVAMIRITVPLLHGGADEATRRGVDFYRTLYPDIKRALPF